MKDDTLAMELLKEQKTNAKRWFIAWVVALGALIAVIAGFLIYLSLPEEVTTVEQQVENSHDNSLVGGDYYSGATESN